MFSLILILLPSPPPPNDLDLSTILSQMQVGAFYPFSRNHNTIGKAAQDPTALGKQVLEISRAVLRTRYRLLPYLYSLFHQANTLGLPVARALVFEYSHDPITHNLDRQFMWGSGLLFTPVLAEGARAVQVGEGRLMSMGFVRVTGENCFLGLRGLLNWFN